MSNASVQDTTRLVNFAEERERDRRMSCPLKPEIEIARFAVADRLCDVHCELLHMFAAQEASEESEKERARRIEEMQALLSGHVERETALAMAKTTARLSRVQDDLKAAFKKMQDNLRARQEEQRRHSLKLHKCRERSNSFDEEEDQERQRRLSEYGALRLPDKRLSDVHYQLICTFDKLKALERT